MISKNKKLLFFLIVVLVAEVLALAGLMYISQ